MMGLVRLPLTFALLVYQSVVLALAQIWANKVRGILTTIGIMIGVAAVAAVIALITGMKDKVLSEFESFGTNRMFIRPEWPRNARSTVSWREIMFKPGDFDALLEHCPSVAKISQQRWLGGSLSYGPKTETDNVQVLGVDPSWHDIEHRYVTLGRPMSEMDNDQVRPVCLINEMVREKLDMERDPVGRYIEWEGNRLMVIGVLEKPRSSMMTNSEARELIMPFKYATRLNPWWYNVQAISKSADVAEEARSEVEFYLRQKRRIRPGQEDTFRVDTAQRELAQFNEIAAVVTMIATGIVGVSLLVGGVGIMNIMLVSVSERTREIGLRKAVGARPSAVLLQFLVEAVVLCMIGGALGLAVGQGITSIVVTFLPKDANITRIIIPPSAIILAFGFSAGVGLIFGMFPAIKAARLDPIEALRHE